MPPVSSRTQSELAYDALRRLILTGKLAGGDKLTLRGLAGQLDIGLTPVRDAIRRLSAERALEVSATGVVRLPVIGRAELDELRTARIPLETALARMAARRIDKDTLDGLAQTEQAKRYAQSQGDVFAALDANFEFHFSIYRVAAAPLILSLVDQLWLRMGPLLRVYAERRGDDEMAAGANFHGGLLAALHQRDEAEAARIMAEDIGFVFDWLAQKV